MQKTHAFTLNINLQTLSSGELVVGIDPCISVAASKGIDLTIFDFITLSFEPQRGSNETPFLQPYINHKKNLNIKKNTKTIQITQTSITVNLILTVMEGKVFSLPRRECSPEVHGLSGGQCLSPTAMETGLFGPCTCPTPRPNILLTACNSTCLRLVHILNKTYPIQGPVTNKYFASSFLITRCINVTGYCLVNSVSLSPIRHPFSTKSHFTSA